MSLEDKLQISLTRADVFRLINALDLHINKVSELSKYFHDEALNFNLLHDFQAVNLRLKAKLRNLNP